MVDRNGQIKTGGVFEKNGCNKFTSFEVNFRRIQKLVNGTVNKLTFAMTIPKLVENNFELIRVYLNEDEMEMLNQTFNKYLPCESLWLSKKTTNYSKFYGMQSLDKIKEYFNSYSTRTENIPQRHEYDFSNALELLYQNENIRLISESNKMSISEAGFNFVQDMKLFMYSVIDKLKMTPQEADAKEAYLRKLCQHHHELTDEAHILEEEAMEQVKSIEKNLKAKLDNVLEIKNRSDLLMEDCRNFIQKSGSDANKKMIFNWKSSEYQKELLEEKVMKQMVDLEVLRKKYVDEEKELRTKRYKTEQHLIAVLDQYDKDMQNKQNELDRQYEVYSMEKEQYDELNEQFQEQEEVYDLIMKEKAEYEQRLFEAKLYELKCAYSARKIQRFYKNFKKLLRIAGKKDLLKNKKKQQRKK